MYSSDFDKILKRKTTISFSIINKKIDKKKYYFDNLGGKEDTIFVDVSIR
jgi:hypothetical protein